MLYHHNPHQWPWDQGHGLWNVTLKFLVKVFFYFSVMKKLRQIGGWTSVSLVTLTCGTWSEGQHDPYFTFQWFWLISWRLFDVNITLWDYESVWPDVWPQNNCRSLWPIFHGPVILSYISKIVDVWTSYFRIMSQYDRTFDLKINVGHCDLYFMVQWFCLIFWKQFDVWTSYFGITNQYDRTFDLKINVGHCDLYFMVQWFYLISWRLFDIWTPYFGIMSWYDPMFDLKIFVAHYDLYFMVQWFCLISWKQFSGLNIILSDYESVWPDIWPPNICSSLWPIFHGPLILPFILKTVWCMNIILSDYESVWHDIWPRNKCRSLWSIFHGPVILPFNDCHTFGKWVGVIRPLTSKWM